MRVVNHDGDCRGRGMPPNEAIEVSSYVNISGLNLHLNVDFLPLDARQELIVHGSFVILRLNLSLDFDSFFGDRFLDLDLDYVW